MDVWHAIQVLKRQGKGKKTIARELKISKTTVKRYWDQNTPPAYIRGPQEKMLDSYAPQIQAMLDQKFIGTRIFNELGQTADMIQVRMGDDNRVDFPRVKRKILVIFGFQFPAALKQTAVH